MSIAGRFINIVKQKVADRDISQARDEFLTEAQTEDLLKDESDDALKDTINKLAPKALPLEVKNAFKVLNINETKDISTVTMAFRKQLQLYHPDKNANTSKNRQQELQEKTSEIIEAYNIIKNYKW